MSDVYCAGCGEPYDTYYLMHELPGEFDLRPVRYNDQTDDHRPHVPSGPFETHYEHQDMKTVGPRYGWEFGDSILAIRKCPACKTHEVPLPTARRGTLAGEAAHMFGGDATLHGEDLDGLAAFLDDLNFGDDAEE